MHRKLETANGQPETRSNRVPTGFSIDSLLANLLSVTNITQQMNNLTRRLRSRPVISILFVLMLGLLPARGDFLWFKSPEKAKVTAPGQLVTGQAPAVINKDAYDRLTPENMSIVISLSRQRLYVRAGDQIAIDSPSVNPLSVTNSHLADELFNLPDEP